MPKQASSKNEKTKREKKSSNRAHRTSGRNEEGRFMREDEESCAYCGAPRKYWHNAPGRQEREYDEDYRHAGRGRGRERDEEGGYETGRRQSGYAGSRSGRQGGWYDEEEERRESTGRGEYGRRGQRYRTGND